MSGKVFPLQDNQLGAANPRDNVWLSASAGTGKTQVLSARVLRLLLTPGVDPSQILCLTFTKAGAAEMATRINSVLARWVRLDAGALGKELGYLGAKVDPATQAHARTLFASVLDCPGGGLRIDTIHAFSQWLLANFPEEAELPPGARPMEDRERELLAREVLAELLSEGDPTFTANVENFARAKEPDALRSWLMRCASAAEMWLGNDGWQSPMGARVKRLLDIPSDADETWAFEGLGPDRFPDGHVLSMIGPLEEWGTKTAEKCIPFMREWLGLDLEARIEAFSNFRKTLLRADGEPALTFKKPREKYPYFVEGQNLISGAVKMVEERRALLAMAEFFTSSLEMGRKFWERWEAAKLREGYLDFDDLIRRAAELLGQKDASAWIRYKLDRSFDHILIDEAQDTNKSQWDIIDALIDDFFSGDGASGDKIRTIFTVGDYKQAIFGFQGTSPENFERAKLRVKKRIDDARASAHEIRANRRLPTWNELDLGRSFRTAMPVLDFVNRAMDVIGHYAFGLTKPSEPHVGDDRPGLVTLWNPVKAAENGETADHNEEDEREQDWLPAHDTQMAEKIAQQVSRWVNPRNPNYEPFVLEKGVRRHATAGDVMVLVRKRRDIARQIVAKLHAKGVAVAGVDRLRLGDPLAVKDLMAALRFASQPLDDLSLANLLASPLIGWSQDDLLQYVPRKAGKRLWEHLRKHDAPFVEATADKLRELLARADYDTPQDLLAWLLTGPWAARRKLVARLGREANDPIDELLNSAFAYQSAHTPSLAGFIEWFDAGTADLKRDSDEAEGQVRVMTVHGSKGLQAPIVILADATDDVGRPGDLTLPDNPLKTDDENVRQVPVPSFKKEELVGLAQDAQEKAKTATMQEHWRLLYVAMTRAEEALFIGGSLGPKQADKGPPEDSWYARLEPVFETDALEDEIWGARREFGVRADPIVTVEKSEGEEAGAKPPAWLTSPIGPEPKPPRPLAPSSAGEEQGSNPPLEPEFAKVAARRGTLIHALLERLPDVKAQERRQAASAWLERRAGDLSEETRAEMLESALNVLDNPQFAKVFSDKALAEVPLAATVDGVVIAGTADRLLVEDEAITVVDFKTARRPPESLDAIPKATIKQMAAYVSALEVIYPGRTIHAAVLYTQTPQLFELSSTLLDAHKREFGEAQDKFAPLDIE
ncbi:double-strand break repair helicase AddA [Erythrobacter sp. SCSIO 43205]|uniref:double-strand break repair helicase AddA n=1 Tax=Erythrobacter sp. SCSIO 43205 TaxID=2779361 RepID=UPI001CA9F8CB|nr:double-strand break repair helicase AddA [Erythrobacter sp. SCSIO 43205]UAB76924.1 double-strand break repair helicase AddA [Erythrobacter sp. SCSIO 43205]